MKSFVWATTALLVGNVSGQLFGKSSAQSDAGTVGAAGACTALKAKLNGKVESRTSRSGPYSTETNDYWSTRYFT